ncbi:MAG TPA: VWA domain-containing protein, partial [Polyangiaceae bacterium]
MRRRAALVLLAALALVACGKTRAPFVGGAGTGEKAEKGTDAGTELYIPPLTPPAEDAGLCGRVVVPIVVERPNFYFVLDASGSMKDPMPDNQATSLGIVPSRYTAARLAIRSLIRKVGHRISYGAALFPGEESAGCTPGTEVFPTQPGDPVAYVRSKRDGPVETHLFNILTARTPDGLTPTAASLGAIKAPLLALSGKTYAFLLTDGAPNCNADRACTAAECTVNIEGACPGGDAHNCCDPTYKLYDYRWCLDADPTVQAVTDLASAGIQTYVIGMPGTDDYANVLDRLAEAGQ